MRVRIGGAGRSAPAGSVLDGLDALDDIDHRIAEAVAAEDWPGFQTLLDAMVGVLDELLGDGMPAAPPPADGRGEPLRAREPGVSVPMAPERRAELRQHVKRGVVEVVTAKERLRQRADRVREELARLDQQARQAADAGRGDLVRRAGLRQQEARQELAVLDGQLADMEHKQRQLTEAMRRAEAGPGDEAGRTLEQTLAAISVEAELAALKRESAAARNRSA